MSKAILIIGDQAAARIIPPDHAPGNGRWWVSFIGVDRRGNLFTLCESSYSRKHDAERAAYRELSK